MSKLIIITMLLVNPAQLRAAYSAPLAVLIFGAALYFLFLVADSRNKPSKIAARGDKLGTIEFNQYVNLLSNKFTYFNMLNTEEQQIFSGRVHYIRNTKTFVTADMEVTEEMRILISAALAQLTFGFDDYSLPLLTVIHFTPESFYSNLIGRDVKGLTFSRGTMILSWRDFEQGYLIPDDKINLGLHEMAHALWIYKEGINIIAEHFDEWHVDALCELQKMRDGAANGFIRNYAATNLEEFWAVSVECFFEAPVDFRRCIPGLYEKTSLILNQEMASRYEQYAHRAISRPAGSLIT